MTCPACGAPIPRRARFCGHCGAAQRTAPAADGAGRGPDAGPDADRSRRIGVLVAVAVVVALGVAVAGTWDGASPTGAADSEVAVDPAEARGRPGVPSPEPSLGPVRLDRVEGEVACETPDVTFVGPCPTWLLSEEGSDDVLLAATDDAFLVATPRSLTRVDAATGETRWRWPVPWGTRPTAVAADAGLAVVALDDGRLHAFSAVIGSERWSTERGAASATALTVTPTHVAVTEPRRLALRGSSNGALLWASGRPMTGVPSSLHPDRRGGNLVAVVDGDRLRVVDTTTDERRWEVEVDGTVAPIADGGTVVSVTPAGRLQAHRRATGELLWEAEAPAARQLVRAGEVIGAATPGGLHVRDAGTGAHVVTVATDGSPRELRPGPDGTIHVATAGSLQLIDPDTAGPTWSARASPTLRPRGAIAVTGDGAHVAVTVAGPDGALIAGLSPTVDPVPQPGPCPGSLVSTALGGVIGWRGDHAHLRPDEEVYRNERGQILLGIPGWPGDGSGGDITVSATLRGADATAAFGGFDDDLQPEHRVTGGARSASGWPTHWAFAGRFPADGCWVVTVATGRWVDTVVVPIDPATDAP